MKKALVVFSGGQDSTTCLGWAIDNFDEAEAITFAYKQKHSIELVQAAKICERLGVKQTSVNLAFFSELVESALTSDGDVNEQHPANPELPASFVPNRNALFITVAHAYAQKIGAEHLVLGVCQTDYSGYPDCRKEFVDGMSYVLRLGSGQSIWIHTPLMLKTKAETFALAEETGVYDVVIQDSHTCYNGIRTPFDWGAGCGHCPACELRRKGWLEYSQTK